MEIKTKLTVTREEEGGGITGGRWGTCTKDLWRRTMGWGLSLGAGVGWAGNSNRVGKTGDKC